MTSISTAADYDRARRTEATAAGKPLPRMDLPAVPTGISWQYRLAHLTASGTLMIDTASRDQGTGKFAKQNSEPATIALLQEILSADGESLIAADTRTMNRIVTLATDEARDAPSGDWSAANVRNALRYGRGMAYPARVVVLTEALARKFYLPDTGNQNVLADWLSAFGYAPGAAVGIGMARLLAAAQSTSDETTPSVEKLKSEVIRNEALGMNSAQYSGLRSQTVSYRYAERHAVAAAALMSLDPVLATRNELAGVLHRVAIRLQGAQEIQAALGGGFSIREGREVVLIDPQTFRATEFRLSKVRVVDEPGGKVLVGTFSGARSRRVTDFTGAKAYPHLLAVEAPFIARSGESGAKRWTQTAEQRKAEHPRPVREVPLDIALAGAPTI